MILVNLLFAAAAALLKAAAPTVLFLIRHPALLVTVAGTAAVGWLLAPLGVTATPVALAVVGAIGTAAGGVLIGRALLEQRRFDAALTAARAADADAEPAR